MRTAKCEPRTPGKLELEIRNSKLKQSSNPNASNEANKQATSDTTIQYHDTHFQLLPQSFPCIAHHIVQCLTLIPASSATFSRAAGTHAHVEFLCTLTFLPFCGRCGATRQNKEKERTTRRTTKQRQEQSCIASRHAPHASILPPTRHGLMRHACRKQDTRQTEPSLPFTFLCLLLRLRPLAAWLLLFGVLPLSGTLDGGRWTVDGGEWTPSAARVHLSPRSPHSRPHDHVPTAH